MRHLRDNSKLFPLSHLMLYTRGWYKQTEDLFEDLKLVLELDGYQPDTKQNIMFIIVNCYGKYIDIDLVDFLNDIQESQSFRIGHYTNNNSNPENPYNVEYDINTAIIRKILSDIRFMNTNTWNQCVPCYRKGLKRPDHISIYNIYKQFVKKNKKDLVY